MGPALGSSATERSSGEDEHSGSEDERSGAEVVRSATEDERSGAEDEHSGTEDEHSGAEDERSGSEDERSRAEDERSGAGEERSAVEVERVSRLALSPFSGNIRVPLGRGLVLETQEDRLWMLEALAEARRAGELGEVPIGAVVVREGEVVGRGHNRREIDGDPLAHAEILALREAARRVGGWRLSGCTLYATLEPCPMCAGALVNSRVERLVYAAPDPKAGYCGTLGNIVQDPRLNHRLEVTAGVLEGESAALLRGFFASLRQKPWR